MQRRVRFVFLVPIALVGLAAAPGSSAAAAPAGRVSSFVRERTSEGGDLQRTQSVTYRAVVGQRNDVRVEITASDVFVSDGAADLTAGSGCVAVDVHEVSCAVAVALDTPENSLGAAAFAGDRDDTLTAVTPVPAYAVISLIGGAGNDTLRSVAGTEKSAGDGAGLEGGPGDDLLIGGPTSDYLTGGPGRDVLHAGAGDDFLAGDGNGAAPSPDLIDGGRGRDRVVYSDARSRVVVDLAAPDRAGRSGERDRLRSIEDVEGGSGDDLLSGDAHANNLLGGPGADRLKGRGGPDGLAGDDADRLSGGSGDDSLRPLTAKSLTCGPGQDAVDAPEAYDETLVRRLDRSCEWFSVTGIWVARRAAIDASGVHVRLRSVFATAVPVSFIVMPLHGGVTLGSTDASIPGRRVTRLTILLNAAGRRYFHRHHAFLHLIADSDVIGWVYEGPIACSVRL